MALSIHRSLTPFTVRNPSSASLMPGAHHLKEMPPDGAEGRVGGPPGALYLAHVNAYAPAPRGSTHSRGMVSPFPMHYNRSMRQEFDEDRDIIRAVFSDKPVVRTEEHAFGGQRHVAHFDADGEMVFLEVHGYSKIAEAAKDGTTTRAKYKADPTALELLGHVDWEATDARNLELVAKGEKVVRLGEMTIRELQSPDQHLFAKQLPLGEQFTLGIANGPWSTSQLAGFALLSSREGEEPTFCWEWFEPNGPTRATKLQETGELDVQIGCFDGSWLIVRTEFLTDVSLRVKRMDGSSPTEFDWRVLIRRGSWVEWPILKNGCVIAPCSALP